MKEWYSAKELTGRDLPRVPKTKPGVIKKAAKESWLKRDRQGKGGGSEYHLSSLPAEAQAALVRSQQKVAVKPPATTDSSESLWLRYEQAPQTMKDEAQRHLHAVELVERLINLGQKKTDACIQVANEYYTNRATIYRWLSKVKDGHRSDWLALLLPRYTGRTKMADCCTAAWECFKADYLRLEKPALTACYSRLERAAAEQGWTIPAERTFARWIKERIPVTTRVLLREGEYALMRRYPALERSVRELHALQAINGDGYQHNVFVRWSDDEIARPKTWFWQDIYSRKILAYRVDTTEHTDQIRLSFGDLVEQYGIPEEVTIDNTRAAANKWMTGGIANRYRFKVKEDDPLGLFPSLGIQVHWTSVIAGHGHGQAKPIERTFGVGGLGEYVDKHPAFEGAYTGANPMAKPENYGDKAVELDKFLEVLNQEIIAWNAKVGRRTEMCAGKLSFDDAFNKSYASAPIRKASAEQRRLWLMSAEAVTVKLDGTFSMEAGAKVGSGRNRYFAPELQTVGDARQKIIVRFDPESLHEQVHCYTLDNRYIGSAQIMEAAGFYDRHQGRIHSRYRKQFMKASKEAAKAEMQMDAMDVAEMLPTTESPTPVESKVTKMMRPTVNIVTKKTQTESAHDKAERENSEQRIAQIMQLNTQPQKEASDEELYLKWKALQQRVDSGESLDETETRFWKGFVDTSAYRTCKRFEAMGLYQAPASAK